MPAVQRLSHLPIVVDPSHGTGKRDKVLSLARAAVAVGCDGLIVRCIPRRTKRSPTARNRSTRSSLRS